MAANRLMKIVFALELQEYATSRHKQGGTKFLNPGWSRETPRVTAPYASISSASTAPNIRCPYSAVEEDRATPAGTYLERDLHVIHGNIVGAAARQAQARRASGR